jgi:hypothetical protein
MGVATEGQTSARAGRCANHPTVARATSCEICNRPLCIACAVPVRGQVIGPECLSTVLVDPPPVHRLPVPIPTAGDRLTLLGFAALVFVSVLPWSRVGDGSGFLGAWTPHWSLVAALAGVLGVASILVWRYRPIDPRVEAAVSGVLAIVAAAAAYLHHRHPLLRGEYTVWPWFAVASAGVAMLGVLVKVSALLRALRPRTGEPLPS